MTAYTTVSFARAYLAGNHELGRKNEAGEYGTTDAELEAALERGSRDVDFFLGAPVPATNTLRLNLLALTAYQVAAVERATVEAAAYRLQLGEPERVADNLRSGLKGEGTTVGIAPPRFAPQMREALADAGLFSRSGTAPPAEEREEMQEW